MRVTTETGSVYEINYVAKTWARIEETPHSGNIRTQGGPFTEIQNAEVGKRMYIIAPGLAFGNRWIHTSRITGVEDAD